MFTLKQLVEIFPIGDKLGTPKLYYDALVQHMSLNKVDTVSRMADFLGTIGHESSEMRYVKELWGPTEAQEKYDPPYRKAKELGNIHPGDGFKYRGRALIECTGLDNYRLASLALHVDYVTHPEWMERPNDAVMVSLWWWASNDCNRISDTMGILGVSRRVNFGDEHSDGTPNGMDARRMYRERAFHVLSRPDFSNVISGAVHD